MLVINESELRLIKQRPTIKKSMSVDATTKICLTCYCRGSSLGGCSSIKSVKSVPYYQTVQAMKRRKAIRYRNRTAMPFKYRYTWKIF